MKFNLSICLLVLCAITAQSQQFAKTADGRVVVLNTDGTWKYAEPLPDVTLKIEAGLVYKHGGPEPVARTIFALLDTDPLPELASMPATEGRTTQAGNAAAELTLTCGSSMPEALGILQKYTRYTITTGFDGKAELGKIKPGKYWIFGATQTRGGRACWLTAIDLTKDQTLTLDQHNAISAH